MTIFQAIITIKFNDFARPPSPEIFRFSFSCFPFSFLKLLPVSNVQLDQGQQYDASLFSIRSVNKK